MITKFRGAIVGTAIGDAAGAPLETMWKKDIESSFPLFVNNCDFVDAIEGSQRAKSGYKRGQWTDDTQLMIPTAWSIIYKGSIDPADIAAQYVGIFQNEELKGWGRSTKESVERLASGIHWSEAAEKSRGTGNGAAMKAAPLGLLFAHVLNTQRAMGIRHCLNSIVDVCKITHREMGIRAGVLQSILIALAYYQKPHKKILEDLHFCEKEIFGSSEFTDFIEEVTKLKEVEPIAEACGLSSEAQESWIATAAIYLNIAQERTDSSNPIKTLFKLVAQGGDCDTTGAMLGALIGARYGYRIFPSRLKKDVDKCEELESMADKLYEITIGVETTYPSLWDNNQVLTIL